MATRTQGTVQYALIATEDALSEVLEGRVATESWIQVGWQELQAFETAPLIPHEGQARVAWDFHLMDVA